MPEARYPIQQPSSLSGCKNEMMTFNVATKSDTFARLKHEYVDRGCIGGGGVQVIPENTILERNEGNLLLLPAYQYPRLQRIVRVLAKFGDHDPNLVFQRVP